MHAKKLIEELIEITYSNMNEVQAFLHLPIEKLKQKQNAQSWNILECIEHLNRYGDFYIPEINRRIENSKYKRSENFKSGILGNYFAKSMLPKEELNKMKTFKIMNPLNCSLDKSVLDKFLFQQKQILQLLEKSKNTDLTRIKTSISISKWIKIRLGDTFRVVIYHNLRHMVQAKNILNKPAGNIA